MSESNIELDNVPSKQATVDNDDNPVADTAIDKTILDKTEKKSKKDEKKKLPKASIREIFSFATPIDCGLMFIGILAAVAMGTALPLAMLLFGDVTNSFINFQISRSTVDILTNGIVLDSFNDSNTLYFTSMPDTFNCSLLQPIVQHYYATNYAIECLTINEFNMEAENTTIQLELVIDEINCTLFADIFTSQFGNVAECLDKNTFINVIDSQIIYFIIIACGSFLLGFIMIMTFHLASERQVYKMRLAYYRAVLRQDIAWFDLNPAGELSSRLSDDLDKVLAGIGDKLALLFQWISTFFAGFAIGFARDWRLTLVLLGLTPFLAIGGALISWVTIHFTSQGQQSYAKAGAIAEEVLSSVKTVVAFGGEHREANRYDKEIKAGRLVGAKKGLSVGFSIAYVFFLLFLSYAVAFWFGGWLVSADYAQGGEILTVFFSVLIGAFAIGQAAPNLESFGTALGAGGAIIKTIKRTPLINSSSNNGINPDNNEDDPKIDNSIELKNVSFKYPARPEIEVLESFSLSVDNGQTVALVGHSGCGKSTVMQLLQRFYDVNSGQVLIGGHPINDINLNYLRSMIGIVSQEPVLFDLTILDNIKFGNKNATLDEIHKAAKDANIHNFIKELPEGYDTLVGERGAQLSGGQKQRVAIARALVRNPRILLLDEATSALDSESEILVQSALEKAREGRTTLVIAHRLSTIQNADLIVVLDKGTIIETGCHGDLMKQQGRYYDMVIAQTKSGVDEVFINISASEKDPRLSRALSHQFSRQVSQKNNDNNDIVKKLSKDEILKKKQEEWDKELASVPITRVMALNAKEWHLLALGVLGAAINGSIFPCFAIIFGELLGAFSKSDDEVLQAIHLPAGLFVVLAFVAAMSTFTKTVCFILSGELLTERIRSKVFRAMLRQEMGWFDEEKHSTGALTTRLSEDAAQVQGATGTRLGTLIETFVSLILALIIAFVYSWIITIVILGFAPFIVLSQALKSMLLIKQANRNKKSQTEAGKLAVDSIENIRTVTSLSLQFTFATIYKNEIKRPYRIGLILGIFEAIAYGISQGMIFFGYVIAFRFGAFIVSLDNDHVLHTEFQNVFRVLFALIFGAVAVGQASAFAPNVAKATVSTNRIFSLLDRKPLIDNYSTEGQKLENIDGTILLDNVSFNYPTRPDVPVVNQLSLTIKQGQTIALVGPSGCGKSTVVSLIERFYDPLQGTVQLDGVPITDINIRWLRTQLGIVSQEPILFDDSIAENIRYGANHCDISDEQVFEAAKAANINDFIQTLPQGYNTNVGDKGTQLSGGQKQRVAIARALIRNPKILLLDEATSALDSESEMIVQEALDKAREGRTSVVIAHRLSTIQSADCIVVVTKGKIAEMGTHSELLAKGGIYYQLHQHQQLCDE